MRQGALLKGAWRAGIGYAASPHFQQDVKLAAFWGALEIEIDRALRDAGREIERTVLKSVVEEISAHFYIDRGDRNPLNLYDIIELVRRVELREHPRSAPQFLERERHTAMILLHFCSNLSGRLRAWSKTNLSERLR